MSGCWQRCRSWTRTRIVDPFIEYLRQDAEPKLLARSATFGFFLGLCPIVGVSTLFCMLVCFLFRKWLHAPMTLLFSLVAFPIEVALIVPFMRFGELVLRADPVDIVPKRFTDLFKAGEVLRGVGHALVGWLIVCAVLVWPVAFALSPLFAFLKRKYSQLRRNDSDEGALLSGQQFHDDRSTVSDIELAHGTPSPVSPAAQRGAKLSPRSHSVPGGVQKFSPHI